MNDSALMSVAFMAGAGSVFVGLALAALLLWWFGGSSDTVQSERRTQSAERRITEINEQARDAIIGAVLGRRRGASWSEAPSPRRQAEEPMDGEWQ